MIEFNKTISASEVKTTYLNLTDDSKRTYGKLLPVHKTEFCLIDENGNEFSATKHGNNQLWSGISKWFNQNNIKAGTRIKFTYDEGEFKDSKPVIHIHVQELGRGSLDDNVADDELDEERYATEISFEFERQLEAFLTENLTTIESGLQLYTDDNGNIGKQYVTDAGNMDLLCIDKDANFLVIELKKKRTSDIVVGQILRYMGWVKENISTDNQKIRGLIITPELDHKLEYAASMVPDIDVKYYRVRLEFVTKEDLNQDN